MGKKKKLIKNQNKFYKMLVKEKKREKKAEDIIQELIKQGYIYNKPLLNSRGEWKSSTLRLKRKAHTCMR